MKIKTGQAIVCNLNTPSIDDLISPYSDWCWSFRFGQQDIYVKMIKKVFGWDCRVIQPASLPNTQITVRSVTSVNGYPYRITLKVTDVKTAADYTLTPDDRVSIRSLSTQQRREFLPDSGYYPTSFVAMLGPVHSGKTCTVCSWRTPDVAQKAARLLPNGFNTIQTKPVQPQLPPSKLAEVAPSGFEILDANGNISSMVYIIDLSGELTALRSAAPAGTAYNGMEFIHPGKALSRDERQLIFRIVNIIAKISDAIVVIGDDRTFVPGAEIHGNVNAIINILRQEHQLPDTICYMSTCADLIQKKLTENALDLGTARLCSDSPVFTSAVDTPDPQDAMYQHMAIAREVLSQKYTLPEDAACFMVSLLTERKSDSGILLDFSKGVNSELPLVYLMRRLSRTA